MVKIRPNLCNKIPALKRSERGLGIQQISMAAGKEHFAPAYSTGQRTVAVRAGR